MVSKLGGSPSGEEDVVQIKGGGKRVPRGEKGGHFGERGGIF